MADVADGSKVRGDEEVSARVASVDHTASVRAANVDHCAAVQIAELDSSKTGQQDSFGN